MPDRKQVDHSQAYSAPSFWEKVGGALKSAGGEVLEKAMWLYFALQRDETPVWAKTTIVGALGYFISPIDAVPDVIPVVGYSDDLAVLVAAVATVASYIDAGVKRQTTTKLKQLGLK